MNVSSTGSKRPLKDRCYHLLRSFKNLGLLQESITPEKHSFRFFSLDIHHFSHVKMTNRTNHCTSSTRA